MVTFYNYGAIFGGRNGSGNRDYQLTSYVGSPTGSLRWGGSSGTSVGMVRYTEQECSLHNGVFTDCNGIDHTLTKTHEPSAYNTYLFLLNNGGSATQGGNGCRIYYLKFYDDTDTMIRNFIPCYRKSDGVIGMYDTVTQTFFTNSGSGNFTKGPDI